MSLPERRASSIARYRGRRRRHDQGAPLCHRHRIVANYSGHPRPSRRAIFHRRNHLRSQPNLHVISLSSAPVRSDLNWRKRSAALARRSPLSSRRCRFPAPIPKLPPSCLARCCVRAIKLRTGVAIDKGAAGCWGGCKSGSQRRMAWRRSKARIFSSQPGRRPNVEELNLDAAGVRHHAPRHYPRHLACAPPTNASTPRATWPEGPNSTHLAQYHAATCGASRAVRHAGEDRSSRASRG